jgi:formaldehyde-activating enzyme involved in methanogenesis
MEEELFESKLNLNEILEEMKNMEEEMKIIMLENERMNEITKDAKRSIYRANRESATDMALGKVLNKFPEREALKIMFLRESEGVYRFGQKRVYIKVEKGGAVYVRIGGGFMALDEFID